MKSIIIVVPVRKASLIQMMFIYLNTMAKSIKKKPAKEASNLFHSIMQASVKGNTKPLVKKKASLSVPPPSKEKK